MPTVHYYGKKTKFVGKTLFEILGNLRNYGVGRMLIKHEETLLHSGKPSYYIVKKVEPIMDEKLQEGAIYAERIFKGHKMPELAFVDWESWHTDWQLVPKHDESKYRVENPPLYQEPGMKGTSFEAPPLLDRFLKRHFNRSDGSKPIAIKLDYIPHQIDLGAEPNKPMKDQLKARFRSK